MKTYIDRIQHLISNLYQPGNIADYDVKMTTPDIYDNLCSIIPANAFDQYDIVEAMEVLGFEPQYEQKTKEVPGKGQTETKVYDDVTYYWYLKKKD